MKTDVLRYLGTVRREVRSREYQGKAARAMVATCAYDTSLPDLWDAITNAERIPRWFLPVSGDLRVGGRYQLQGNAGGTITACEPPWELEVTWEFGGQLSWVRVTLSKLSDGGTQLQLEHIAHVPDDFWKQYGPGATGVGWDLALYGLDRHIVSGAPLDPKEAAAWTASEEGRKFIQQSSDGWCEASIAGGAAEVEARDAAARTFAFYTGGQ
jgi:uncharacterized protein YndB with AHSA1/START domain